MHLFFWSNVKNVGPGTSGEDMCNPSYIAGVGRNLTGFLCHGFTSRSTRPDGKQRKSEVIEQAGNTCVLSLTEIQEVLVHCSMKAKTIVNSTTVHKHYSILFMAYCLLPHV